MSQVFAFNSRQIRTLSENAEIWFAAIDVCRALGISWRGNTLACIPEEWRRSMRKFRMEGFSTRDLVFISEPAVYKLAFRSNKPEADAFTNWVASEVLPAIRKSGKFETPTRPRKALPPAAPLPIYRNGMYHLPPVNKRHQPGPQEAALMTLWGEWFWREGDIKRAFDALEKELDARVADLIHHAISDLGRNADTCFSVDAMIEGLRCARTSARRNFDEAMDCLRTHLKMALNVAVMLNR